MDKKIIGLVGQARSGKSTAAEFLEKKWDFRHKWAFAEPLKRATMELFDLTWDQVEGNNFNREEPHKFWGRSVRDILQVLGTEGIRDLFGKNHFAALMDRRLTNARGNVVITDLRFPNEVELVRKHGGTILGLVHSGDHHATEHAAHSSEDMATYELEQVTDHIIHASNTNELYTKLDSFAGGLYGHLA